uniref:dTMP kinase n=1 Tax=Pseudomonas phage HRDY3 TaxID=3236930 RepID=A0AB39CDV2_9VIRU
MKQFKKRGKFICLESIEAAGKGTASIYVGDHAIAKGYPMAFTREPGGTPYAETLRRLMLDYEGKVPALCQPFLSYAARIQHTEAVIRPALESGTNVFTERYYWSALAYQTRTCEATEQIHQMADDYGHLIKPDLTILLDLPPEVSFERMHATRAGKLDEFEKKPLSYFAEVREAYYGMIDDSWVVIDAQQPLEEVRRQVLALIDKTV